MPALTDLLEPREPVLVGLSGGVDSVVLLHLLARAGHPVTAAHLDHGLRPESAGDAAWVAAQCQAWDVPLIVDRQAVPPGEEAAREARHAFLVAAAGRAGLAAIALGHHAGDQAETVLFRLARGTGPAGLAGMARSRTIEGGVRLIRPLLGCTRPEILDLARGWGLAWREDPSNEELAFARNRIRHVVVPALEAVNPLAVQHLAALAEFQREDTATRQEQARRQAKYMVQGIAPGVVEVDRRALVALPPADARWVLREAAGLRGVAFEAAAVARALATAGDGAPRDLGGGWRASATPDVLVLSGTATGPAARPFQGPGDQGTGEWGWQVTVQAGISARAAGPACVRFDASALPGPLIWRGVEPDHDAFQPWGAARPMGVRAFLGRQGIPRHRQASLLALAAGETLAWLVGVRRGALAVVGKQATEVVEMQARASFRV
ncbi:MAG: tRNA(Ile)-lysidine synthetase [Cyanobacteria bacterium RYN_339]|nr:tRNA(Ile)-lysidine synthetase [Cyanobacteria bacterium RYN_339]